MESAPTPSTKPNLHDRISTIRLELRKGNHYTASQVCEEQLNRHPGNETLIALYLRCFQSKGDSEGEFAFLSSHLKANDVEPAIYLRYIALLNKTCRLKEALIAIDNFPHKSHPGFRSLKTEVFQRAGRHSDALINLQEMLAKDKDNWQLYFRIGILQHSLGNREEAIKSLKKAYELNPDSGGIYWHLANIKSYSLTDNERRSAKIVAISREMQPQEAMQANYALGKYYEDQKEYALSFDHYSKANHHQRILHPYDKQINIALTEDLLNGITSDFRKKTTDWGLRKDGPIFVVGLPRSGTTLLEQILCSHSDICAMGELYNIIHCARTISIFDHITPGIHYENYSNALHAFTERQARHWGARYFSDTKILRDNSTYFVDKMPSNFWHIPLIKAILPDAKIIDIRRHPVSSGFSVFKQCFPKGHNYSNGLESTARNYAQYQSIMNHYHAIYPNAIYTMHYENLVNNTEKEIRNVFQYLAIPFEERCLTYYQTDRAIRTPSSEQVRQPIFKKGTLQWKNYAAHLDILSERLSEIIDSYESKLY